MKKPFIKNERSNESGPKSNTPNGTPGDFEHPTDGSQGGEYLDDAIRMHEQPLSMFMQYFEALC